MAHRLSPAEIVVARQMIAVQASTLPPDRDIGPAGAWRRAEHVSVLGRNVHERFEGNEPR